MTNKQRTFTIFQPIINNVFQTIMLSLAHVFKGYCNIYFKSLWQLEPRKEVTKRCKNKYCIKKWVKKESKEK